MQRHDYLGSPSEDSGLADSVLAGAGAAGPCAGPPSRRAVLRTAAGAGAAAVAVTSLAGLGGPAPRTGGVAGDVAADEGANSAAADEQLVVHVRDARTGQIDVFRGTRQVRLHDRELARLLDRVSRG
jgi:hypothetical protein